MPIRTASIPVGATFAPSGGTATSITVLSGDASSMRTFVATTGVTPLNRTEITFSAKQSKVSPSAPGGFTQGRSSLKITVPKVLANGARTLNSATVELALDPETTAAELNALRSLIQNLIVDADFDMLWLNQSID